MCGGVEFEGNSLRKEKKISRRHALLLSAIFVSLVLGIQLVAATAWAADAANDGPGIVILQMSDDPDTNWAVRDLQRRLSEFITDDPYFPDRVRLVKTSDPYMAMELEREIVVYASHGGPLGIVTGNRITLWETMADIVSNSRAMMHLFTACSSRNIIQYGDESSDKKLYTVPGARPAEVTNIEVVSTIMLALGINAEQVDEFRTSQLEQAKELVESGASIHIMDFAQIVLDEIEYVDDHYSDSYTTTHRVYRYSVETTLSGIPGFVSLPLDLQSTIVQYYRNYIDEWGVPCVRNLEALSITYTKNYHYEAWWVYDPEPPPPDPDPDPDPPPDVPRPDVGDPELFSAAYIQAAIASDGHWEYGPDIFSGGAYSGIVIYAGDGCQYLQVVINVTASGTTLDANGKTNPESIALKQIDTRGIYVQKQKVDGVWQEPVTGRNPSRTGGAFTDACQKADYEYDSTWPVIPGLYEASGTLTSNGEYLTITGVPTGSSWHGPSFVQTLPSYFKLKDFGSLSANLSLVHHGSNSPLSFTAVSLYDVNKKVVAVVNIVDYWGGSQDCVFHARYYKADGTGYTVSTGHFVGDTQGVVQVRYDPLRGIFGDAPGISETCLLYRNQMGSEGERLIKYLVIQSYRYSTYAEHDERIYNIQLSYAGSEYTIFHDSCNDMDDFVKNPDFPYGYRSDGTLGVPSGQSYMKFTSIATGTGWHGPIYTQTLDRPFRLYQLDDFSVIGEMVQSSSTMGSVYVALFDETMKCALLIHWGDAWVGSKKAWFNVYFYPQNGGTYYQESGYIYTSFTKTGKLWWDPFQGGDGAIMASIDGSGSSYPIGEVDNASRVIKYIGILGYRYSSYNLVDMRIHDINVICDLNEHDPNAPMIPPPTQDPPPGEIENPTSYDGTSKGPSDDGAGRSFTANCEQTANNAVTTEWQGWWPTLLITCTLAIYGLSFVLQMSVDILGSLTVSSASLSHSALNSASDEDLQASTDKIMGLSPVKFYSVIAWAAMLSAKFFATFGLLPAARALFTASLLVYVGASIAMIVSIAQAYLDGSMDYLDAFIGLTTLTWGIVFAGNTISTTGIFGRIFSCLDKYRSGPLESWGYHDTFFMMSRVLVLLLGFTVAAGIFFSGPN